MGAAVKKDLLPFPLDVVGTFSCHGVEPGVRAGETSAKINQDRGCIVYPFKPTDNGTYCKSQALFCSHLCLPTLILNETMLGRIVRICCQQELEKRYFHR